MKKLSKGLLITLEGGEGCGKTTMAKKLVGYLASEGYDAIYSREPGGSKVAEEIRNIMLYNDNDSITDLFLLSAARRINCVEVIKPALQEAKIVVCDRYTDSTTVYQGYVGGVAMALVDTCNGYSTNHICPDCTIILDVNAELGMERAAAAGHERNKNDVKDIKFYRDICDGYRSLPANVGTDKTPYLLSHSYRIDGSRKIESVFNDVLVIVQHYIEKVEITK
jgi:dTMP kinase